MENQQLVELTADIVAAHVAHNNVAVGDVTSLIQNVHGALAALGTPDVAPEQKKSPVVSVRASIKPDYIICMECGQKHKMLKRHLLRAHGMSPDQYRADYGLARDYPLVAPNYSEQRRTLAHAIGLGRQRRKGRGSAAVTTAAAAAPKGKTRKAPAAKAPAEKAPAAKAPAAKAAAGKAPATKRAAKTMSAKGAPPKGPAAKKPAAKRAAKGAAAKAPAAKKAAPKGAPRGRRKASPAGA